MQNLSAYLSLNNFKHRRIADLNIIINIKKYLRNI